MHPPPTEMGHNRMLHILARICLLKITVYNEFLCRYEITPVSNEVMQLKPVRADCFMTT